MNFLLNPNILKISTLLLVLSTLMMMLVKKLRKLFTQNKLKAMVYALIVMTSFALIGLLSSTYIINDDNPLITFLIMEILFVGLGILHLWALRRYFPGLSEDESDFFSEFLFSLIYVFLGLIAFLNVVDRFNSPYSFAFSSGAILFMLPLMIYRLYEQATMIPVPVYETWKYPLSKDIADPTEDELKNPVVISFELRKRVVDLEVTNFRVKAPRSMKFGTLFYFFIEDYNERHPESKIEFVASEDQNPYEWMFHLKPNFFGSIKHMDFDKTIATNSIKEDAVVICKRVNVS